MNKKKIAVAAALAALAAWTVTSRAPTSQNRVLADAFPAGLLLSPASCTTPEWPSEARRYEVDGITVVHFQIGADGRIDNATVAKSSSWTLLDEAALRSLVKCTFKPGLDEAARTTYPIQFVWTLSGPPTNRPALVPGSCRPSRTFSGFERFNRAATAADGVLVRFLVDGAGKPVGVKAEGVVSDVAALDFISSCKFAVDASLPGDQTDTVYGRVLAVAK
ncbi:MAG: energy transducer TonB [Telluria sp.]